MAQRNRRFSQSVATLALLVLAASGRIDLAIKARALNAHRAGHPPYADLELPGAVREYLGLLSQQRPIDPRIADVWGPNALTPKQREDKALAIYRSDHNGAEPPQLSYADSANALRDYGSSPALTSLVAENSRSVDLFCATWFPGNGLKQRGDPEYALELSVTPAGCILSYANIWDWAEQGGGTGPQPAEFVSAIRQLLAKLPVSEKHPQPDKLLIVTFRTTNGWETRLYDRTKMAPTVAHIFNLIGKQQHNRPPSFDFAAMVAK